MWPTAQKLHAAGEQHVASAEELFGTHLVDDDAAVGLARVKALRALTRQFSTSVENCRPPWQ